jgi:ketosteroid isomerase-like protein
MFGGLVRPKSRGRIQLTGPNPMDPVQIETNMMSHPDDLKFDQQFTFTDHALGLEFKDKGRLIEFLAKTRELFPDSERRDNTIFSSGDRVISEWTLTATKTEPFWGGLLRKVEICVQGISVVQIKNGKISQWSDYYDQLKSWRHGLVALFTEWIEL